MELPELIQDIGLRPGLYVIGPYFSAVCAFITGYNHARDGGPLAGWREWLIVRFGGGNNLLWEKLVEILIEAEAAPADPPAADPDATRLRAMAALFAEFFRDREAMGVTKIHHDYAKWLLRQRWYDGPLRKERG